MTILPLSEYPFAGMVKLISEFPEAVAVNPDMELLFPVTLTLDKAPPEAVDVTPTKVFQSPEAVQVVED